MVVKKDSKKDAEKDAEKIAEIAKKNMDIAFANRQKQLIVDRLNNDLKNINSEILTLQARKKNIEQDIAIFKK